MTQRKRRTYVLVVALGLGAIAVDRLVLRPDATPADARAGEPAALLDQTVATGTAGAALSIPELPFPRDLPSLNTNRPFRDLFARKSADQADAASTSQNSIADVGPDRPSDSATFVAQHRLEAVMSNAGLKIAVVNGVWLRVGQSIGECKLVTIDSTRAHFVCRNDEAVLDLRNSSGLSYSGR